MEKLSFKNKIIYALGGLGYALITVMHMLYLVWFFFPPADAGIPYFIPQEAVFLSFTFIGLVMALGRIFDAVSDPLIATWSDNTKSKLGRRIPFMRYSALFVGLSYVLVFFVPDISGINGINMIWLAVWLSLSTLFLTSYLIPQTALMVELAVHPDDKVDLATLNSVLWFAGFLIVSFSGSFWNILQNAFGLTRLESIQYTFLGIAAMGVIFMLIPAFLLKEPGTDKINKENIPRQPLMPAIKKVFRNKDYAVVVASTTLYNLATTMFEAGLIYYLTVLALQDAKVQGPLTTIIGAITFASYPFLNKFSKSLGKKRIMRFGFILFFLLFVAISLLGVSFIPYWLAIGLVIVFAPLPQSIFGVLPNAITADCASWDKHETGEDSAGMYFAANGFVRKLGQTLGALLFTSLLLLGKDVGHDAGIRMAAVFGGIFSAAGFVLMQFYNEKKMLSYMDEEHRPDSHREVKSDPLPEV
ncbi:MAG: MFS transporter [Spirochaetales bacterium]|nr:MFS transporter [Spirochaetales bacterium]